MKKGWDTKKIGDILKLEYGKPLPESERDIKGKYPAYGANGIKSRTNKYFYDEPSIIVGRKGSAGEVTLVDAKFWPLDVTYFVTHDSNKYDIKYLYLLLKSLSLPQYATGVKPGINRNVVYAIEVQIPDIKEQRRIVKTLDKKTTSILRLKEIANKQLHDLEELDLSLLQQALVGKL